MAGWLGALDMPDGAFLAALPLLTTLGGQIAVGQIVFVVFLGESQPAVRTGRPTGR